jgi:hypothetical protein
MFEKVKEPPRKIWTPKEKAAYQRELREQRKLREQYRKRLFDPKR